MEQLIIVLIERLVWKGMEVTSIPAYTRDLANTIAVNGYLSLRVNRPSGLIKPLVRKLP